MRMERWTSLAVVVLSVLTIGVLTTPAASAGCESCQKVLLNPDFCFADATGWTKCNDTGPTCVDSEIAGSTQCGGGGGGGENGGDGNEVCNGDTVFCPVECMSCDPFPV